MFKHDLMNLDYSFQYDPEKALLPLSLAHLQSLLLNCNCTFKYELLKKFLLKVGASHRKNLFHNWQHLQPLYYWISAAAYKSFYLSNLYH